MPRPNWTLAVAITIAQVLPGAAQAPGPAPAPTQAPQRATRPAGQIAARTGHALFGEIHGKVLDAAAAPMPRQVVRLRSTRTGKVADTTQTDAFGAFAFAGIEPGNYVVELVGGREEVLAASPLLTVDTGDTLSTIVKLPIKTSSFGDLLGNKVSTAAIIAGTAAAAGVLSVRVANCVSPPCEN